MSPLLAERLREDLAALEERDRSHPLLKICGQWVAKRELSHADRKWLRENVGWMSLDILAEHDPLIENPVTVVARGHELDPDDNDARLVGSASVLFLMHVAEVLADDAPMMRACVECRRFYIARRKRSVLQHCSHRCTMRANRKWSKSILPRFPSNWTEERREQFRADIATPVTLGHFDREELERMSWSELTSRLTDVAKFAVERRPGPGTDYTLDASREDKEGDGE